MKIPKEWSRVLAFMRVAESGLYFFGGSSLALAFILGLLPSTSASKESGIQFMTQQLDMLDQLDFQQFVAEARKCTEARDFVCADGKVRLAAKRTTSSKDKEILALVRQGVIFERQVVQREESERIARETETRLQREEVARLQLQEAARLQRQESEAQREREAKYARQESERNSAPAVNYGAAMMEGFNSAMAGKARIDKIHNEGMVNIANTLLQRQRQEQEQRDRNNAFMRQQADEARRDQVRQEQSRNAYVSQSNSREAQRNEESRTTLSMERQQREARQRQLDNLLADSTSATGAKPTKTDVSIGQNQNQKTEPIANVRQGGSPRESYMCPTREYFTQLLTYRTDSTAVTDLKSLMAVTSETLTPRQACDKLEPRVRKFVAGVGNGSSYTYGLSQVSNIETCQVSKSGDQVVVYVNILMPSSSPCGRPANGISK